MLVGEIGISRHEFLYDIQFWEVRRIIRGYYKRHRDMWSAIRWHAYNVMSAMPYTDLQKAGIRSPRDLLHFDWDDEERDLPSEEEVDDLVGMINELNERGE